MELFGAVPSHALDKLSILVAMKCRNHADALAQGQVGQLLNVNAYEDPRLRWGQRVEEGSNTLTGLAKFARKLDEDCDSGMLGLHQRLIPFILGGDAPYTRVNAFMSCHKEMRGHDEGDSTGKGTHKHTPHIKIVHSKASRTAAHRNFTMRFHQVGHRRGHRSTLVVFLFLIYIGAIGSFGISREKTRKMWQRTQQWEQRTRVNVEVMRNIIYAVRILVYDLIIFLEFLYISTPYSKKEWCNIKKKNHTHTHTHTHTFTHTHIHTHSLSLTLTHSLSLSHSHSLTHSLSLSLSLTHTHTHSLSSIYHSCINIKHIYIYIQRERERERERERREREAHPHINFMCS